MYWYSQFTPWGGGVQYLKIHFLKYILSNIRMMYLS